MHKYIIANWKSHQNVTEINQWLNKFKALMAENNLIDRVRKNEIKIVIAPSFVNLSLVEDFLKKEQQFKDLVFLSTQDLSPFEEGSYTGEVGTENLTGHNVDYAIVGHSERRSEFCDNNQEVAKKVASAVDAGIIPILCLDEAYVESQAKEIDSNFYQKCLVAYEPLAAIGSGKNAKVKEVERVVLKIKQVYGKVSVIYGGSVNVANIEEYLTVTDGALVGTASKIAEDFVAIIKAIV